MKVKYLAAACAALCAGSAFAINPAYDPTNITPVTTYYIAGASAQQNALKKNLPVDLFDAGRQVTYIANKDATTNKDVAFLGDAADGSGILLIIYNSKNGSAAGINQVKSATTTEPESKVMKFPLGASTCVNVGAPSSPNTAQVEYDCSAVPAANLQNLEADLALSDVYQNEFASGIVIPGTDLDVATSLGGTTGLEGFGVIVNSVLYDALLAKNIADGLLPSSCSTATASTLGVGQTGVGGNSPSVTTFGCQPSVRSAEYAMLAASGSTLHNYTAVVAGQTNRPITVCRRDNASGTQAASNIFFLDNICGKSGPNFGSLTPVLDTVTANYSVIGAANSGTDKAENCVWSGTAAGTVANTNYSIGIVTLGEKDSRDKASPQANFTNAAYYFVKLDGVSPNYDAAGHYDPNHRANLIAGSYKFSTEMEAYVKTGTDISSGRGLVVSAISDTIADSTKSNDIGIGYLDGGVAAQQARFSRGGNNCSVYQK